MDTWKKMSIVLLRVACLLAFIAYGIHFSVASVASFCALIASFSAIKIQNRVTFKDASQKNPLKGKPPLLLDKELPEHLAKKVAMDVSTFVCHYDAQHAETLQNFQEIQHNTPCIFAKKARLWGSARYDSSKNLEYNIRESLPTFLKFTLLCQPLGLDGFVFEIPDDFGRDVQTFGSTVRQILQCISQRDPNGKNCMEKRIDAKGWVFEFNRVTFFITTFASCYPPTHPRFAYNSDACYLLFQPEISFAQHDLPSDTVHTNWTHPRTVRDHIRVAFREHDQEYFLRDTVSYPMAWDIVRPLNKSENFVTWWK